METALIIAAIPVLMVLTGRVDYTFARRAGIKEYGLAAYERKQEDNDKFLAVMLGIFFPITWALALVIGLVWLFGAAVTARPHRSKFEKEENLRRLEKELGYPPSESDSPRR